MLEDINHVIFITLDCCRYDTIQMANTPFLRSLGEIRAAQTYATYTLPAHISFFAGYLPNVVDDPLLPLYSRTVKQLWRLNTARKKDPKQVEVFLNGNTILDGYREMGYYCLGTGGVRWFRNSLLTNPFDRFMFWGCDDTKDVFTERTNNDFSLNHYQEISDILRAYEKWFLFINAQETHVPYDLGLGLSNSDWKILSKAAPLWGGKMKNVKEKYVTRSEFSRLHELQIIAVEQLDFRIERLLNALPGKKLLVICGDHGEAFGENQLYGHGFPDEVVTKVPLMITVCD